MSRTTMSIVAGIVVLGFVVAMLPAQESSRRTAKNRSNFPGTAPERPNLSPVAPEAELPPIVTSPGRAEAGDRGQESGDRGQEARVESAVPADPTGQSELNDTRLHSVL